MASRREREEEYMRREMEEIDKLPEGSEERERRLAALRQAELRHRMEDIENNLNEDLSQEQLQSHVYFDNQQQIYAARMIAYLKERKAKKDEERRKPTGKHKSKQRRNEASCLAPEDASSLPLWLRVTRMRAEQLCNELGNMINTLYHSPNVQPIPGIRPGPPGQPVPDISTGPPGQLVPEASPGQPVPEASPGQPVPEASPGQPVPEASPGQPVPEASPGQPVPEASPGQPVPEASPGQPVPEASPGQPVPEASPGQPVPEASPGQPVPEASPGQPVPEASPGQPVPEASPGQPVPEASPGQPVPEASPGQPVPEASPGQPVPEASPGQPVPEASPGQPVGRAIRGRSSKGEPIFSSEPEVSSERNDPAYDFYEDIRQRMFRILEKAMRFRDSIPVLEDFALDSFPSLESPPLQLPVEEADPLDAFLRRGYASSLEMSSASSMQIQTPEDLGDSTMDECMNDLGELENFSNTIQRQSPSRRLRTFSEHPSLQRDPFVCKSPPLAKTSKSKVPTPWDKSSKKPSVKSAVKKKPGKYSPKKSPATPVKRSSRKSSTPEKDATKKSSEKKKVNKTPKNDTTEKSPRTEQPVRSYHGARPKTGANSVWGVSLTGASREVSSSDSALSIVVRTPVEERSSPSTGFTSIANTPVYEGTLELAECAGADDSPATANPSIGEFSRAHSEVQFSFTSLPVRERRGLRSSSPPQTLAADLDIDALKCTIPPQSSGIERGEIGALGDSSPNPTFREFSSEYSLGNYRITSLPVRDRSARETSPSQSFSTDHDINALKLTTPPQSPSNNKSGRERGVEGSIVFDPSRQFSITNLPVIESRDTRVSSPHSRNADLNIGAVNLTSPPQSARVNGSGRERGSVIDSIVVDPSLCEPRSESLGQFSITSLPVRERDTCVTSPSKQLNADLDNSSLKLTSPPQTSNVNRPLCRERIHGVSGTMKYPKNFRPRCPSQASNSDTNIGALKSPQSPGANIPSSRKETGSSEAVRAQRRARAKSSYAPSVGLDEGALKLEPFSSSPRANIAQSKEQRPVCVRLQAMSSYDQDRRAPTLSSSPPPNRRVISSSLRKGASGEESKITSPSTRAIVTKEASNTCVPKGASSTRVPKGVSNTSIPKGTYSTSVSKGASSTSLPKGAPGTSVPKGSPNSSVLKGSSYKILSKTSTSTSKGSSNSGILNGRNIIVPKGETKSTTIRNSSVPRQEIGTTTGVPRTSVIKAQESASSTQSPKVDSVPRKGTRSISKVTKLPSPSVSKQTSLVHSKSINSSRKAAGKIASLRKGTSSAPSEASISEDETRVVGIQMAKSAGNVPKEVSTTKSSKVAVTTETVESIPLDESTGIVPKETPTMQAPEFIASEEGASVSIAKSAGIVKKEILSTKSSEVSVSEETNVVIVPIPENVGIVPKEMPSTQSSEVTVTTEEIVASIPLDESAGTVPKETPTKISEFVALQEGASVSSITDSTGIVPEKMLSTISSEVTVSEETNVVILPMVKTTLIVPNEMSTTQSTEVAVTTEEIAANIPLDECTRAVPKETPTTQTSEFIASEEGDSVYIAGIVREEMVSIMSSEVSISEETNSGTVPILETAEIVPKEMLSEQSSEVTVSTEKPIASIALDESAATNSKKTFTTQTPEFIASEEGGSVSVAESAGNVQEEILSPKSSEVTVSEETNVVIVPILEASGIVPKETSSEQSSEPIVSAEEANAADAPYDESIVHIPKETPTTQTPENITSEEGASVSVAESAGNVQEEILSSKSSEVTVSEETNVVIVPILEASGIVPKETSSEQSSEPIVSVEEANAADAPYDESTVHIPKETLTTETFMVSESNCETGVADRESVVDISKVEFSQASAVVVSEDNLAVTETDQTLTNLESSDRINPNKRVSDPTGRQKDVGCKPRKQHSL